MAALNNEIKGWIQGWSNGAFEVPEWSFDGIPAFIVNHMQIGIVGDGRRFGAPAEQELKVI